MRTEFLPKALNGIPGSRACLNINLGRTASEPHFHDCVEMIYVYKGCIRAFFQSEWRELPEGSLLFVPPGCIHRCVSTDDGAEQLVIGFTDELVCDPTSDAGGRLRPYRVGAITDGYVFSAEELSDVRENVAELRHITRNDPSDSLRLYATVLLVYGHLLSLWEERGVVSERLLKSSIATAIREYVCEHYAENISARSLAEKLCISYSYLSKIMTREFGMSLGDYFILNRIEQAKRLLIATAESVAQIAYGCGFASSSAFISHFKAQTGKTPLAFRKAAHAVG